MSSRTTAPRPVCRRLFLRGAGGLSLGLPFLPSLATRRAHAADPVFPRERFFFALLTEHGAAFDSNMFPSLDALTDQANYAGSGHAVRWGRLRATAQGSDASLSPILTAPATKLAPSLVGKLNVLYGLDTAMHLGHHRGGALGNFADTNGTGQLGLEHRPTIDQIMAWSPSFYADTSAVRERSLTFGPSWGYSNGAAGTGTVQKIFTGGSSRDLFDRLFAKAPPTAATRKPIVDRILANYKRLRDGDRRLSADDRVRLDGHIARLAELERRLGATAPARACSNQRPANDSGQYGDGYSFSDYRKWIGLYNDVFAMAFACGASRIAVMSGYPFPNGFGYGGSWHQDIAHQWSKPSSQDWLVRFYRSIFADAFVDFAAKLDAIPTTPGRSVLDDAFLMWTQEAGMDTHWQLSIPVVTAGGAGGAIKTGFFVDYRNRESPNVNVLGADVPEAIRTQRHGLLYNQFLATALQAVGVPRTEFERWGHAGYGQPGWGTVASEFPHASTQAYYGGATSKYFQIASDPMPVIAA